MQPKIFNQTRSLANLMPKRCFKVIDTFRRLVSATIFFNLH